MPTIRYHGHSNVEIVSGSHVLQIDPFYTSNPLADLKAADVKPTHILLSHAHFDHVEDAEAIAKRTGAPIIANYEIATYYSKRGVANTSGLNTGGGANFPFGRVTLTLAFHSSTFQDGSNGGEPNGLLIETGGKTIYFAGDTALFGDMALIGKLWNIDLALLPIGDGFTMGPAHAVLAAEMLKAKRVMPIHFDTFPPIKQDTGAFAGQLREKKMEAVILKPGGTYEL